MSSALRRRLRLARERGYLNAGCRDAGRLLAAYSRWCWQLRIPIVWSERRSPHSRYGRVRLDLFTTANRLNAAGQSAMRALAPRATISPHDGCWDFIPLREVDRLARAVMCAAVRPSNYRSNRVEPRQPAKVVVLGLPRAATA
jgi:hypothetical protein